jgi:RimJ/RimL family protein N-acetyltransferase
MTAKEHSVKNPYLVGEKVYLRPLEREDAPLFVSWFNDHEVTRTLQMDRPVNLAFEEEFIAKLYQTEQKLVLGIAVTTDDRLIGSTGLHPIDFKNRHGGFGIAIGEKGAWGKGYGTEATHLLVAHAFATLNLNRVYLHVHEDNVRGRRAYAKVGFQVEGLLRQERYREGCFHDTLVMSILRQEWEAQRRAGGAP